VGHLLLPLIRRLGKPLLEFGYLPLLLLDGLCLLTLLALLLHLPHPGRVKNRRVHPSELINRIDFHSLFLRELPRAVEGGRLIGIEVHVEALLIVELVFLEALAQGGRELWELLVLLDEKLRELSYQRVIR